MIYKKITSFDDIINSAVVFNFGDERFKEYLGNFIKYSKIRD